MGSLQVPQPQSANKHQLQDALVLAFLQKNPKFAALHLKREEVQNDPAATLHFAQERQNADGTSNSKESFFFKLHKSIALDLQLATQALTIPSSSQAPQILDICMAPGAYLSIAHATNPSAKLFGITLPETEGGHRILMQPTTSSLHVTILDVTTLACEFGLSKNEIDEIAAGNHPDAKSFLKTKPYEGMKFPLIIADGNVLRTHARAPWRADSNSESERLLLSQLILAMQRIEEGGTLVLLLHHLETWRTVELLFALSKFADTIRLWKHGKIHGKRSSFYVVVRWVRPGCGDAQSAVGQWKRRWRMLTFGEDQDETDEIEAEGGEAVKEAEVKHVLEEFGEQLVRLGEPLWEIQFRALDNLLKRVRAEEAQDRLHDLSWRWRQAMGER